MQPADLQRLPDGACLTSLQRHADHRGFLAEVFRRSCSRTSSWSNVRRAAALVTGWTGTPHGRRDPRL